MKNILLLFFGLIAYSINIQCQDTICIEKRTEYFSATDTIDILSRFGKNTYYIAKYAKEFIRLSEYKGKVEYCFYYDNQRFVKNIETHFSLDNNKVTISEGGFSEIWIYQRVEHNLYQITKQFGNIKEVGYAKSIMPLEKVGDFYTIGTDEDTLYSFQYDNYIWSNSINITTDTSCNIEVGYCEIKNVKMLQKYFNNNIWRNYRIPSLESRILDFIVIEFSLSENGEVCDIKIVKSNGNAFLEKAILNVFGEKGFKYLTSNMSNCKIRLFLKEPYFLN